MCFFFDLRKYAQITVRSTGTKWRGRCKHCGDAGSLPSFALILFCLRELDCAGFRLSHIHCEVPPTLNKMDVLNEYFGRFGPAPKFLWRKRPASTASENHAWLQRYSFSPRWVNLRPVSSLQINQSRHEAVSLLALYDFVWVVRVLESCHVLLVNKPLSQSLQPTCKSPSAQSCGRPSSLLPAWRTRRRFQQAVRMKKWALQITVDIRRNTMPNMLQRCQSCKKYGPNFQDMIHWYFVISYDSAQASQFSVWRQALRFPVLNDPSIGSGWSTHHLELYTTSSFDSQKSEINIVSGCGKATARNQF